MRALCVHAFKGSNELQAWLERAGAYCYIAKCANCKIVHVIQCCRSVRCDSDNIWLWILLLNARFCNFIHEHESWLLVALVFSAKINCKLLHRNDSLPFESRPTMSFAVKPTDHDKIYHRIVACKLINFIVVVVHIFWASPAQFSRPFYKRFISDSVRLPVTHVQQHVCDAHTFNECTVASGKIKHYPAAMAVIVECISSCWMNGHLAS